MRRNRLAYVVLALLVALLAVPTLAHAARGDDVIADCHEDGHIDGNYSQDDYQDAQDNLPSDIDQYGSCRDVIAQAQADGSRDKSAGGAAGGSGGDGGQGRTGGSPKPYEGDPALQTKSGAYAPSQDDKAAYDRTREEAASGGSLPGGLSIPTAGDFKPAGADNSIPLPVLLALVSVGLLIAATTALVARKRLPGLTSRVTRRFGSS
jgi:hypothetical protein